jgi:hypothetical protein
MRLLGTDIWARMEWYRNRSLSDRRTHPSWDPREASEYTVFGDANHGTLIWEGLNFQINGEPADRGMTFTEACLVALGRDGGQPPDPPQA